MQRRKASPASESSVDADEIRHFAKDSARWWDAGGPFAPLHRLNPVRLRFIRDTLAQDNTSFDKPLKGMKVLDIGCGGGLVCEPLARLGATVTGLDADENAIAAARAHAAQGDLKIDYLCAAAESLLPQHKGAFDAVLALEIVEHVGARADFIATCGDLVRPGGTAIFSTLNRTVRGFVLGIVAAEHLLGWVPKGTHSWKKFVRPHELAREARAAGLSVRAQKGLIFNPLIGDFALSDRDFAVNYLMAFSREKQAGGR